MITSLGSADAALDAVILALNAGYQTPENLTGIYNDDLNADGSVIDVEPDGSARNFLADGEGEGAFGSLGEPATGDLQLVGFFQGYTLEAVRRISKSNAEVLGGSSDANSALQFIVELATPCAAQVSSAAARAAAIRSEVR